jgi:Holliday junction DNA helicase RuvA
LIGRLHGRLLEIEADGSLVIDVGGVGYELQAPLGTPGRSGAAVGDQLLLHVHTHVREDALLLYGFATATERMAFRTLIGISKVGPKLALAVLSALEVSELALAVATADASRLTRVSGIGKKTAERMVLELDGKLSTTEAHSSSSATRTAGPNDASRVLCDALLRMGFKPGEVDRAVASMGAFDRPMGELIRDALSVLAP